MTSMDFPNDDFQRDRVELHKRKIDLAVTTDLTVPDIVRDDEYRVNVSANLNGTVTHYASVPAGVARCHRQGMMLLKEESSVPATCGCADAASWPEPKSNHKLPAFSWEGEIAEGSRKFTYQITPTE